MAKLKTAPKFMLIAAGVTGAIFGGRWLLDNGYIPKPQEHAAVVPHVPDVPTARAVDVAPPPMQPAAGPLHHFAGPFVTKQQAVAAVR